MRRVILESPYAGTVDANIAYARACLRDCLKRGEAALASHLLYTQDGVLSDDDPDERRLGIEAGLCWRPVAELSVFYTDLGWSYGMLEALRSAEREQRSYEFRALYGAVKDPPEGDARLAG